MTERNVLLVCCVKLKMKCVALNVGLRMCRGEPSLNGYAESYNKMNKCEEVRMP